MQKPGPTSDRSAQPLSPPRPRFVSILNLALPGAMLGIMMNNTGRESWAAHDWSGLALPFFAGVLVGLFLLWWFRMEVPGKSRKQRLGSALAMILPCAFLFVLLPADLPLRFLVRPLIGGAVSLGVGLVAGRVVG